MLLRICGERRADSFECELNFLQIFRKNARSNRIDRHLTLWPSANDIAGARRVPAPSRPDSISMEANAAKTSFLQAVKRSLYRDPRRAGRACSGASMQIRGAASLADVPYWRKPVWFWPPWFYPVRC